MKNFLLRCLSLSLLCLATLRGESMCLVDAFVFPRGIRVVDRSTKGRSCQNAIPRPSTLPSRPPRARELPSSPFQDPGTPAPGTALASVAGPASTFLPPKFQKSRDHETFIEGVLEASFIFQAISASGSQQAVSETKPDSETKPNSDFSEIVAAFEEVEFPEGACVCKQGDFDGEYLYLIREGDCSVSINGTQLVEPYGTMSEESLVGEMAMLYDTARAATVTTLTPVKAFRLHRDAFNYFLALKTSRDASSSSSNALSPRETLRRDVKEIDNTIDQIAGLKSKYGGDIIPPFKPSRSWLWRQWKGTILEQIWKTVLWNMSFTAVLILSFRFVCNNVLHQPITWAIGSLPDSSHYIVSRMLGLSKIWNTILGLVTFVLTFFLGHAYGLWTDIYVKGRQIQGDLSSISLLAACRAERDPDTNQYTPKASKALEDIAGYVRLFNKLTWASLAGKFQVLLTPKGLSRMLGRGIMTKEQYKILMTNASQPQDIALEWIYLRLLKGIAEGAFPKSDTVESVFTENILGLRTNIASIRTSLQARIPLAYGHFVQFLVDTLLVIAPCALYPEFGIWSIPAVGVLSVFYGGLLDLSKILLSPLENDDDAGYTNTYVNMDIAVLIRQSNTASYQWQNGVETLPF